MKKFSKDLKIKYDETVDAASIEFSEKAVESVYACEVDGIINIHFATEGEIKCIEIIPASKFIPHLIKLT